MQMLPQSPQKAAGNSKLASKQQPPTLSETHKKKKHLNNTNVPELAKKHHNSHRQPLKPPLMARSRRQLLKWLLI
jgi:hypothetical protein